jgi:hypothetical protein
MQYMFSLLPKALDLVEKTMSPARLARYLGAARQDKNRALRLYIWNAELCQEFYLPIQMTEVSLRNSIRKNLQTIFEDDWFADSSFVSAISERSRLEINDVVAFERAKRGTGFTIDHVIARMSFGFWLSLLNAPMTNRIWSGNIHPIFPNMPHHLGQSDVHQRLERLRLFRNAVMHHYAIFDKAPGIEWENIKIILGWICQPTVKLMMQLADPKKVLSAKPSI